MYIGSFHPPLLIVKPRVGYVSTSLTPPSPTHKPRAMYVIIHPTPIPPNHLTPSRNVSVSLHISPSTAKPWERSVCFKCPTCVPRFGTTNVDNDKSDEPTTNSVTKTYLSTRYVTMVTILVD
ncbi:hypothetical protein DPMN_038955 [Dreissena polymorpha]|uniref:Uncharacterized protein n=1 Tax=Dreissena polymorpha TaxID=45954 RepID=A0A9D4MI17_DREPO|nr:hypothetical protein DPMN_038955 [Dreissena polymorpha]